MESPKVNIPKEFRKNLSDRFDYGKKEIKNGDYVIDVSCLLCEKYFSMGCDGCPFSSYNNKGPVGCRYFVNDALNSSGHFSLCIANLWWLPENDEAVRQELATLREKAEGMIEWV